MNLSKRTGIMMTLASITFLMAHFMTPMDFISIQRVIANQVGIMMNLETIMRELKLKTITDTNKTIIKKDSMEAVNNIITIINMNMLKMITTTKLTIKKTSTQKNTISLSSSTSTTKTWSICVTPRMRYFISQQAIFLNKQPSRIYWHISSHKVSKPNKLQL